MIKHVFNYFYSILGIKVNIYFRTLDNETVQEVKNYSGVFSYLGALGGAISLFLGASLLEIFELIELLIRLLVSIFTSK